MALGGKRPGAGRPKGSKQIPQFRDFVSDEDRAKFVEFVLSTYMEDVKLTIWVGDQLYGKPTQAVQPADENDEPFAIAGFNFIRNEDAHPIDPPDA
jgi:hypothetical protein